MKPIQAAWCKGKTTNIRQTMASIVLICGIGLAQECSAQDRVESSALPACVADGPTIPETLEYINKTMKAYAMPNTLGHIEVDSAKHTVYFENGSVRVTSNVMSLDCITRTAEYGDDRWVELVCNKHDANCWNGEIWSGSYFNCAGCRAGAWIRDRSTFKVQEFVDADIDIRTRLARAISHLVFLVQAAYKASNANDPFSPPK
jgi:hypothetical protein